MGTWDVSEWRVQQLQKIWMAWIHQNWQNLVSGKKIIAPGGFVAPAEAGFEAIGLAHPVGQTRDWGLSMTDGSRIHIHEFANGQRVVHRDKYDPKRGLGSALAHLMQETPYGILACGIGALVLANQASNG